MKTELAILVLIAFATSAEIGIGTKIEPLFSVKENGSLSDSGKATSELHRAQISMKIRDKTTAGFTISGELSLDATEKSTEAMIHNGYVQIEFAKPIGVEVGRSKPSFSRNASIGSSKLPAIYRSWTSEHLENELGVAGYIDGVRLFGELFENRLNYAVSLNHAVSDERDGFSAGNLVSLPIVSIGSEPIKGLNVRWDMAFPLSAISTTTGATTEIRPVLHDWSVHYKVPKLYSGSFELFLGPDTAEGRLLKTINESYKQNISYSLQTMHEFSVPLSEKIDAFGALGAEYCNGLNRLNGTYVDRDFYWATTIAAGANYGKFLRLLVSADEQFDSQVKQKHQTRLAVQLILSGDIKIKEETK